MYLFVAFESLENSNSLGHLPFPSFSPQFSKTVFLILGSRTFWESIEWEWDVRLAACRSSALIKNIFTAIRREKARVFSTTTPIFLE